MLYNHLVMQNSFSWLVILAVIATFVVLVIGVISMIKGGSFNAKYGNKLMRYRVVAQLSAIVLIAAAFLLGRT